MRPSQLSLLLAAAGALAAGCTCSPATPVPITMKVVNSTTDPIYLDGTGARLGLTLEREVLGQLYPFDDLACACRYCSNACNASCACPDAGPMVQRVEGGGEAQRDWSGVVLLSGTACPDGTTCVRPENAPTNESFVLQLCYSTQAPSGVVGFDDGGLAPGLFDAHTQTCVTKHFRIEDGVVEIGPERGASCSTSASCPGAGELCFAGSCTTGCPANSYPAPGTASSLGVGVHDEGFFTQSTRGAGTQRTGTGTVTAVDYAIPKVYLARTGSANERLTGYFTLTLAAPLPATFQLPVGTLVSVMVADNGQTGALLDQAVTVRDATTGQLLLAAETGIGGPLLVAADVAPFSVSNGATPVGCQMVSCGKLLYFDRGFTDGTNTVVVEPGGQGSLVLTGGTWTLLNVSDAALSVASPACDVSDIRPWVLWRATGG